MKIKYKTIENNENNENKEIKSLFSGKIENSISIILTVNNKEFLIEKVLCGIFENISDNVKEIIIVLDGCTDKSKKIVENKTKNIYDKKKINIKIIETNDIYEVKANNAGLKLSNCEYSLIIQDDIVIDEKFFDTVLLEPFLQIKNCMCVSGRMAHNCILAGEELKYTDKTEDIKDKNYFFVRDVAIRGPILIDNNKLKMLGYFDEIYAPLGCDDHDLCIRGFILYGWVSGHRAINFISKLEWGGTRQPKCIKIFNESNIKNIKVISQRYSDFLSSSKHNQKIIMEKDFSWKSYSKNTYSQNGEDGIIEHILEFLDIKNGIVVEFGAWDGIYLSNICNLWKHRNFEAILIESDAKKFNELIKNTKNYPNTECVNALISYKKDSEFHLDKILDISRFKLNANQDNLIIISIDIDSCDYYIFEGIEKYLPKIIICEVNSDIDYNKEFISYDKGCSIKSLTDLANIKGYEIICHTGNAIFVRNDIFKLLPKINNSLEKIFCNRWIKNNENKI